MYINNFQAKKIWPGNTFEQTDGFMLQVWNIYLELDSVPNEVKKWFPFGEHQIEWETEMH